LLKLKSLSSSGDTIVEVLIAIAIVSFVLVAAYVTVNKNTLITRDTQERAQALQLATTQLEFLRSTSIGSNICFDASGTPVGTVSDRSPCTVGADGNQAVAGAQPAYAIAITSVSATNYKVTVTWASLSSATSSNVTLYYQP